jgi:hypothetical protein
MRWAEFPRSRGPGAAFEELIGAMMLVAERANLQLSLDGVLPRAELPPLRRRMGLGWVGLAELVGPMGTACRLRRCFPGAGLIRAPAIA